MNWVYCGLAPGEIVLTWKMAAETEMELTVGVPVIYGGGGPGHYPLIEKTYRVASGRVQFSDDDPHVRVGYFTLNGNTLRGFLFGKRRTFRRR